MKFNFRLKSVLNIKEQAEDILKIELGEALGKLDMENKKLDALTRESSRYMQDYRMLLYVGAKTTDMNSFNIYFGKQKEKIEMQKESINKAKENVDKIREELIKVSQEKEMLEKLKNKKQILFNKELLKEEQKFNNEIISYRQNMKLVEDM
ncbi:MAG TPA: flagellar export protein FliJ [Clostridiales bacterium]|nr:flagellar export protein FliJ [Clostridiales bacterium]